MTHHANHCLYTTISLDGTPKYTDYSYASDISKELITKPFWKSTPITQVLH